MRTNAANIKAAMVRLNEASPRDLQKTIKYINSELNSGRVKRGSDEWKYYIARLKETQSELRNVKKEMALSDDRSLFTKIKDGFNEWAAAAAAALAAVTGLVLSGKSTVQAYADMEAEEANVRKFTGMTEEQVGVLNKAFKKINTRTGRENLNKLAQEAGRLGKQSIDDVLGFVKAADQINVALDDLGDGATLTLSKLTGIFGIEDEYGTERSLLKVGSVVNELSQNCSASSPYLAEFTSRLGGIAAQSGIAIDQTMAYAAVLDSQNLAVEASATAVGQLITKIYKEPAQFAQKTGLEVKKFTDMVKTDMNGALIMLFEHLNKFGGMATLAKVFDDLGTDGARAIPVLTALAGHVEELKAQQLAANEAFQAGISVAKEFNVQNNTVQARIDKAKKRFNELAVSLGEKLLPVMQHCISGSSLMLRVLTIIVDFIIEHKTLLLTLSSTLAAYNLILNAHIVKLKLVNFWTKAWLLLGPQLKNMWAIGRLGLVGLINTIQYFTNGLEVNIAMQQRWRNTMSMMTKTSWGAVFLAIAAAVYALTTRTKNLVSAQKELAKIRKKGEENAKEEINRLRLLEQAAQDETLSLAERKRAIQELNDIIPAYNGNLDETTGLYNANKKALDDYIDSLIRLYEIEAAKETLSDLAKQKFDLKTKRNSTQKDLDSEIFKEKSRRTTASFYSDQPLTEAYLNEEDFSTLVIRTYRKRLEDIDEEIGAIEDAERAIIKEYGVDALKPSSPEIQPKGSPVSPTTPDIILPESDEARKKREKEDRERMRKAKEALQAELDNAKYDRDKEEAENIKAYSAGLKNYTDYMAEKERIEQEYADRIVKIHERNNLIDIEAYGQALLKREELKEKSVERQLKLSAEQLDRQHDADERAAIENFYNPDSTLFDNQKALNQKLFDLDIKLMNDKAALYKEGSKEREQLERQIADRMAKDQLDKQKELVEAYKKFKEDNSTDAARQRMISELEILKQLLDAKLISEENYEKALAKIRSKYRAEVYGESLGSLDKALSTAIDKFGLAGDSILARWRKGLEKMDKEDIERFNKAMSGNPILSIFTDGLESAATFYDTLKNISTFSLEEILKNIGDLAEESTAIIGAITQTFEGYWTAQRDSEIAQIEKRYQVEIDAAKKNSKKVSKLEAQKEAEIAKVKNKYNDKAMRMEIAMATAQTAVAAINAYASASKENWLLGPIAAAMAAAAGAVQIATIKKQHEAEAAGYYSGGFTPKDPDDRREVGVVHANEFVANHQAVANPALSPVLRLIDHAQRTNTVGSLTADDVDIALGRRVGVSARGGGDQSRDNTAAIAVAYAAFAESNAATREALDRLAAILADGLTAEMVMDGENGFHKKYERYKRLISNPKR